MEKIILLSSLLIWSFSSFAQFSDYSEQLERMEELQEKLLENLKELEFNMQYRGLEGIDDAPYIIGNDTLFFEGMDNWLQELETDEMFESIPEDVPGNADILLTPQKIKELRELLDRLKEQYPYKYPQAKEKPPAKETPPTFKQKKKTYHI